MKGSILLVIFLCAVFLVVAEAEERRPKQVRIEEANVYDYAVVQQQDGKNKKTGPLKQDRAPKQLDFGFPPWIYPGSAPNPYYLLPSTLGIGQQMFYGSQGKVHVCKMNSVYYLIRKRITDSTCLRVRASSGS